MCRKISLIGAAVDACAGTIGAADTPKFIQDDIKELGLSFNNIYYYTDGRNNMEKLHNYFTSIANDVQSTLQRSELPVVIGGDHSCAIGTWSGIANSLAEKQESLGLIWIDAHMDAHTPDTTLTGNIHGMPVATLLGYGYIELTHILNDNPKIKPENIILIGIRSFEDAEAQLLIKLGVKIYYNYDVAKYGINRIFNEALGQLQRSVDKIGLSIDLDGFDPKFAPGVGTKEPDGINFDEFIDAIVDMAMDKIVAVEITEGNAHLDSSGKTMSCVVDIIRKIKQLECINVA